MKRRNLLTITALNCKTVWLVLIRKIVQQDRRRTALGSLALGVNLMMVCGLGAVVAPAAVEATPFCASPSVSALPAIVYIFDDSGNPVAQPDDIVSEGGVFSASWVLLGTVDADNNIIGAGGDVIGYVDGASSGG